MSELDAYRSLYIAESRENHENIVKNLLILESGSDEGAIGEIFRSAHSLKGMSASMGFEGMETLCHAMEDVFQEIRNGSIGVGPDLVDNLLETADDIEGMLDDIEGGGTGIASELDEKVSALKAWISGQEENSGLVDSPAQPVEIETGAVAGDNDTESVPVPAGSPRYHIGVQLSPECDNRNLRGLIVLSNLEEIGHIEAIIPDRDIIEDGEFDGSFELEIITDAGRDALEVITSVTDVASVVITEQGAGAAGLKKSMNAPAPPADDAPQSPAVMKPPVKLKKSREIKNLRVNISRLDQMMNLIEDLVINRGRITQIAQKYQIKELDETLNMVGRSVSDLQDMMMKIRMIPLNHIFNRFPRTVRDIAHREGKEVDFIIEGGETDLDRSVMDGLNDPLMHIIRNAIDHGIESPHQRELLGKPTKGTIRLSARRDRDNVIITIEDDGGGINVEKVKEKAQKAGLISGEAADALSNGEAFDLLLLPGFSTAETITDISGRGVGLDVVKNSIESLKGIIRIESSEGKGTKFELLLPPTMAIVNVMMVRINGKRCAIPVNNVVEVASLAQQKIHRVGLQEAVMIRGDVLPLDRLDDMFGFSEKSEILVVLQNQNRKRSIVVDMIEGQQEVVIKPLSTVIGICRGVSGVTIPGDGEVVPVIDVNSILKEV
ncbi:MAG TPA: chemotaxis protein CheA [Methanoregulaceae archaeon]|nr:chemotaxis protein CheA [Methanoregulaceae archaeon]